MIKFSHKGDFKNVEKFLKNSSTLKISALDKYGKKGVDALRQATPKDTGKTSESWTYSIVEGSGRSTIIWTNTNVVKNTNIAIILQYGHATGWGTYVKGVDYINPAMKPIFDEIAEEAWKEVTKR